MLQQNHSTTHLQFLSFISNEMGKKMKFPFLSKTNDSAAASPWPWPACVNTPKTLSFRSNANPTIYKTINSAYLDDSFSTIRQNSLHRGADDSFSSANEETAAVIGALRSDRLFFNPEETSSILEEANKSTAFPYGKSARITAVDSDDPFLDFRASMAEMVEAHRLRTWECLEELLTCYLRVNEKRNHGYIIEAFVDLLVHIALQIAPSSSNDSSVEEQYSSSSTTTQHSFTSPLSFSSSSTYSSTSPRLSPLETDGENVAGERT